MPVPGRPGDQQILVPLDPLATCQLLEQAAIEAAGGAMIDILRGRLLAQAGEPEPGGQSFGVRQ